MSIRLSSFKGLKDYTPTNTRQCRADYCVCTTYHDILSIVQSTATTWRSIATKQKLEHIECRKYFFGLLFFCCWISELCYFVVNLEKLVQKKREELKHRLHCTQCVWKHGIKSVLQGFTLAVSIHHPLCFCPYNCCLLPLWL